MDRELIRFLIIGFVAGWISAIMVRGRFRMRGCLTRALVGITGAIAGGYVFGALGVSGVAAVVGATIGAVAFLVLFQALRNA